MNLSTKTKTTALRTPLYDFHKSFGAKLVNFAGYEMPIQYQDGIIQEHLHTRNAIGIFKMESKGNQNENIYVILSLIYVDNLILNPGIFFLITLFS